MIATLQQLIAPSSERDFSDMLRARAIVHRASESADRFKSLLTEVGLLELIESGQIPQTAVRITLQEQAISPLLFVDKGSANRAKISALLDRGASVVVDKLDPYVPALGALCGDLRRRTGEQVKAGAILTSGSGGALKLHYDPEDLIILQLAGSKHWMIFDSPVSNPIKGMPEQPAPPAAPVFDRVLQGGDFLFLPAGYRHHCENGPGRSLHLGIFIKPPTPWHALKALVDGLLAQEAFRVPLTRHAGPAEAAAHAAVVKAALIAEIDKALLADVAAEGFSRNQE